MTTPDTNPCYMCGHTAVVKTFREFETEKLSGTYYYCANCYTKIITSYFIIALYLTESLIRFGIKKAEAAR